MTSTLSRPFSLPRGGTLPNRIVKSATSEQLAGPGCTPSEPLLELYRRWARGGAGLLITGNVMVDRRHLAEPGNVALEQGDSVEPFRRWAACVRGEGARLWMQINHPGRQAPRNLDPTPVAPSAVPIQGLRAAFAKPRPLCHREIEEIVERFAATAALAGAAGFDGVQIHAAHGYLVSQFLSPRTNRRCDAWGGSANKRMRLLREILRAVRDRVGADLAVGVKLNSADFQRGGFTEEQALATAEMLAAEGIDLLEISGGTYERPEMFRKQLAREADTTRAREAFFLDFAERVRDRVDTPLLVTGGFRTRAGMERAIAGGAIDLAGMARPLILEPELPKAMLEQGRERALPHAPATGIRLVDSALVLGWYQVQLQRLARGQDAAPTRGRAGALAWVARAQLGGWLGARPRLRGLPTEQRKTIIVTGASSGFGKQDAILLASRGHRLIVTSREEELAGFAELEELASSQGYDFDFYSMDLTSTESIDRFVDAVEARHGGVDVLVNNAGYGYKTFFDHIDIEAVRKQFETNVFGTLHLTRRIGAIMKRQGSGRIINISSLANTIISPTNIVYAASKWALEALTEAMYLELQPYGVQVASVQSNAFETRFTERFLGESQLDDLTEAQRAVLARKERVMSRVRSTELERMALQVEKLVNARRMPLRNPLGPLSLFFVLLRKVLPERQAMALIYRVFYSAFEADVGAEG